MDDIYLPIEILDYIFEYAERKDYFNLNLTCKLFYAILQKKTEYFKTKFHRLTELGSWFLPNAFGNDDSHNPKIRFDGVRTVLPSGEIHYCFMWRNTRGATDTAFDEGYFKYIKDEDYKKFHDENTINITNEYTYNESRKWKQDKDENGDKLDPDINIRDIIQIKVQGRDNTILEVERKLFYDNMLISSDKIDWVNKETKVNKVDYVSKLGEKLGSAFGNDFFMLNLENLLLKYIFPKE